MRETNHTNLSFLPKDICVNVYMWVKPVISIEFSFNVKWVLLPNLLNSLNAIQTIGSNQSKWVMVNPLQLVI